MKKEKITRVRLTASEGMVLIKDGKNGCIIADLVPGDEGEGWYEITEEEYAEIAREASVIDQ